MKEMHFCTELRKSIEAIGGYAYKIPDMPGGGFATRFNPDKPYDMVASINGKFIAIEKLLANETPTSNDPNNPGPLVKATPEISSLLIHASLIAASTTGTMFC